jgi:hypothetical protein
MIVNYREIKLGGNRRFEGERRRGKVLEEVGEWVALEEIRRKKIAILLLDFF